MQQGLNYFIKYVLCLDTTMLRKIENENKNQNKKSLRLKIYRKIRNGRLKLEPSGLIKKNVKGFCSSKMRVQAGFAPPGHDLGHDLQLHGCDDDDKI